MPGKIPTESLKKVLKDLTLHTDAVTLADCADFVILDSLKSVNLYQSLKADEARLAKVRTEDNESYWKFLSNTSKDTIDQTTLDRSSEQVLVLKDKDDVMSLFNNKTTDFELDDYETYAEKYLTTGKTISDFKETVDFYNYWLQASIYCKLVWDSMKSVENRDDYTIEFKFVVIDKYNQAYVFDVSQDTLSGWAEGLGGVLKAADYHYKERNFTLPYEFLVNKVKL